MSEAATTVTIGTVNNVDMIVMQKLSTQVEEQHPDVTLIWKNMLMHPVNGLFWSSTSKHYRERQSQ